MNHTEEIAYRHIITQLKDENKKMKDELMMLRRILSKQKSTNNVRKPQ